MSTSVCGSGSPGTSTPIYSSAADAALLDRLGADAGRLLGPQYSDPERDLARRMLEQGPSSPIDVLEATVVSPAAEEDGGDDGTAQIASPVLAAAVDIAPPAPTRSTAAQMLLSPADEHDGASAPPRPTADDDVAAADEQVSADALLAARLQEEEAVLGRSFGSTVPTDTLLRRTLSESNQRRDYAIPVARDGSVRERYMRTQVRQALARQVAELARLLQDVAREDAAAAVRGAASSCWCVRSKASSERGFVAIALEPQELVDARRARALRAAGGPSSFASLDAQCVAADASEMVRRIAAVPPRVMSGPAARAVRVPRLAAVVAEADEAALAAETIAPETVAAAPHTGDAAFVSPASIGAVTDGFLQSRTVSAVFSSEPYVEDGRRC